MVEVKNKEIIKFSIVGDVDQESRNTLTSAYSLVNPSSYTLRFTNEEDQLIRKSTLKTLLDQFKSYILDHQELSLEWVDTNSRENCCSLDFQTLVNDFFLAIFFLPQIKLKEECYYAYGNQKITKHLMQGEAELLTPEGIVKRHEIENCQANLLYHEDWD